jgi:protoporphyrin/coproporphyrin ferrochelatase
VEATASAIAKLGLKPGQTWSVAFQSAPPNVSGWLEPELLKQVEEHAVSGGCMVVIPVQFCAEHLEVLYDIDVLAKERATAHNCKLVRAPSLNVRLSFIQALAQLAVGGN